MRLLSIRPRAGADTIRPAPRAAEPWGIGQHPDLGGAAFGPGAVHARLEWMGPAWRVDLRPGRLVVSGDRHVADVRGEPAHGTEHFRSAQQFDATIRGPGCCVPVQ